MENLENKMISHNIYMLKHTIQVTLLQRLEFKQFICLNVKKL